MTANELFDEIKAQVFDLLDYGHMKVIFGEYINQKFDVYVRTENTIEVEYN